MMHTIHRTASPMTHIIPDPPIFSRAPMPRIGAYSTMRSSITTSIWICWMSLVQRVISEAVENVLNSLPEKETTCRNTAKRRFSPNLAATRDANSEIRIAAATISSEKPSIFRPAVIM